MNIHRGKLGRARANPDNTLEVDCAICSRKIVRQRGRIERARLAVTCSRACCYEARRRGLIKSTKPVPSGPTHAQWEGLRGRVIWYGANWKSQRNAAKQRDQYTCQDCGQTEAAYGRALEVHHIVRFLDYDTPEEANVLSNLRTLCKLCHRRADAILYYARKASGVRAVPRARACPPPRSVKKKFATFGEVAALLARHWRVQNKCVPIEGESGLQINRAMAANTVPSKSRGLCDVTDKCQVTSLLRANAEIEADCWLFTLQGENEPDPRLFEILLEAGDHKRIASAQRVAFLDWEDKEMRGGRGWTDQRVSTVAGERTGVTWSSACGIGPRLPPAWRRWWPVEEDSV